MAGVQPKQPPELLSQSVIDRVTGLAQYEGDEQIYRDILKRFSRDNEGAYKKLVEAIGAGDNELAFRTAHSLRGAAGTIGAGRLADAAICIEKTLASVRGDEPGDIDGELLNTLEKELQLVLDELEPFGEMDKKSGVYPGDMDRTKTIALLDKLIPFLETGNTGCLEYLDEAERVFRSAAKAFRLFVDQIELYDFEQACDTAKELRKFLTL